MKELQENDANDLLALVTGTPVQSSRKDSEGDLKMNETNAESINIEELKKEYGELYMVEQHVDGDDMTEGRLLQFYFTKPTTQSFNRYLKTASKNMATSTTTFVMDNVIKSQENLLKQETDRYPGLALAIGQKLLASIGMGDDINFKRL